MKKRSTFDWILIGILVVLLVGAGAGFAYLISQYQAPTRTEQTAATATVDATTEALYTLVAAALTPYRTPTPGSIPTERSTPTEMVSPTSFTVDLTTSGTQSAALPSHFIFGRPFKGTTPFWPLNELRYGSGTNFSSRSGIHTGLDFMTDFGAPVYAIGSGEVIWVGFGIESNLGADNAYGWAVTIKHDTPVFELTPYSIYAHLNLSSVEIGDQVREGDKIGEVGLTGNTSTPHLHLEVRLGGTSEFISRNPELFIRPLPNHGVLAARILNTDGSMLYGQEIHLEHLDTHQVWTATSYANGPITTDAVYKENLVIGDLPVGQYAIVVYYGGAELHHSVFIRSGQVTFFTLRGFAGYMDGLPVD
jgi:murein DD-endopeptidase MepM/ murein hydrolase activator NlpD